MSFNPYKRENTRTPITAARIDPTTGTLRSSHGRTKFHGAESFVGANGEINASDKRDYMRSVQTMLHAAANPGLLAGDGRDDLRSGAAWDGSEAMDSIDQSKIVAALSGRDEQAFQVVGEELGTAIYETTGRQAFSRNFLKVQPRQPGETARWRIVKKEVGAAYQVTGFNTISPCEVRNYWAYPQVFSLTHRVDVSSRELALADTALLDEKYQELLEQMFRKEDLIFKAALDALSPAVNTPLSFNAVTPTIWQQAKRQVAQHGIPVRGAVIAYNIWDDIVANTEFSAWYDPVTKHELVRDGKLGRLMGVEIMTDGLRYPTLRVLNEGEVYYLSEPQFLGGIDQYQEIKTVATNGYNEGETRRGWVFESIQSLIVLNSRACQIGQRT